MCTRAVKSIQRQEHTEKINGLTVKSVLYFVHATVRYFLLNEFLEFEFKSSYTFLIAWLQ